MKQNDIILIKQKIKNLRDYEFTKIYGFFHKIEKKILFMSFVGKQYSDNPRAISEKMHEIYPDYKLVWYIKDKKKLRENLPTYIKIVTTERQFYQELATSFCFVNNYAMESNIYKKRMQFFVQTWHGDRGFKKVLYDAWDGGKRPFPVCDNKLTDICLAASEYGVDRYRNAFKYDGEILQVGMPRNDKLINVSQEKKDALKQKMNIDKHVKVLLYAPTLRDNSNRLSVDVDLNRIINCLKKKGEDWIGMLRAHPGSSKPTFDLEYIVDMTDYPDMSELMIVADMLITDYSSCAGDFIIQKKPVILAVFDKMEYEQKHRAFKVSLEDTGYLLAHNQLELEDIILNYSDEDYEKSSKKVLDFYGAYESGSASEQICRRIHLFYESNFE